METELKTAIWKIANAAIEMHEDKLNGKEFEELAMDALRQVKNLNIPCVNIALENKRKAFCIWYYAQSQPLDANKVFDWFSNDR